MTVAPMTIALGFCSPNRLIIIRLASLDAGLAALILALLLAVAGLGIDAVAGLTIGTVALPFVAVATWLTFTVLCYELRRGSGKCSRNFTSSNFTSCSF